MAINQWPFDLALLSGLYDRGLVTMKEWERLAAAELLAAGERRAAYSLLAPVRHRGRPLRRDRKAAARV